MPPRHPELDESRLTPEQRAVFDAIRSGPRGKVEGPLRVWLQSPELASRAQALGAFCRYGTSLPPRLSELAILVTGAHWRSGFEWAAHAPIALAAGLPAELIEAIRTGGKPVFPDRETAAVWRFANELTARRTVSDAVFAEARAVLGTGGVVELVGILGYYTLISMTINVFEVPLPPGVPDPFVAS